jgi:hypothetical protein
MSYDVAPLACVQFNRICDVVPLHSAVNVSTGTPGTAPQLLGAVADKVLPDSVAPTELTAYM